MAKTRRTTLKHYGIGCGLLVLLVVVVLSVMIGSVFFGYREAFTIRADLERLYDTQEEYTPDATGAIPAERLQRFLAVRESLLPLCETVSTHQRLFSRIQEQADAEEPPSGAFFRDALRAAASMLRVGRDFGDYVTARNAALLEQEMGLGEYTWIYVVAYLSWLDHPPLPALAGGSSKNVYRDRVFPQVREMIRRQVELAGEVPSSVAWRSELELLDRVEGRIPFEHGLPRELEVSLEPLRDKLERLGCPAASELEVVLTVKSGIGYDHR